MPPCWTGSSIQPRLPDGNGIQRKYVSTSFPRLPLCVIQRLLLKEYSGTAKFLEATGAAGVEVIKKLNHAKPDTSPSTVRSLHALLTPQSRVHLVEELSQETVTLTAFESAARRVEKAMWVDFHWRTGNTLIDASKGVSKYTPFPRHPCSFFCSG